MPKDHEIDDKALQQAIGASPEVRAELTKHAKRFAAKANRTLQQRQPYPDYDTGMRDTDDGPVASVFTRSNHAKFSNAKNQILAKIFS